MSGRSWRLVLPYQTPPLSKNVRLHRMEEYRVKRNVRDQVRWLIRAQKIPRLERIHIELHYRPAVVRIRDSDNLTDLLKPAIDGTRDYPARYNASGLMTSPPWVGIVADDDPTHVTWSPPIIHEPDRSLTQRLWIDIEDRSNEE